jgi:hypothetical protein
MYCCRTASLTGTSYQQRSRWVNPTKSHFENPN